MRSDLYSSNESLGLQPLQIDGQKAVRQIRALNFDTVGKDEGSRELPRCDASVEIIAGLVVLLFAADCQLLVLERYLKILAGEARNR